MLPDRVSNPGPLTYESGALPIALRGPAVYLLSCYVNSLCYLIYLLSCYVYLLCCGVYSLSCYIHS